jgi:AMP nucleosidase
MTPDGVKTDVSDKTVTANFVNKHLQIGIDALEELANSGESVKHLKYD